MKIEGTSLEKLLTMPNAKTAIDETKQNAKNANQPYLEVCYVCGKEHDTRQCSLLLDMHRVKDEPITSRARQTLPQNLEITIMADGSNRIIAKSKFQKGTTFGPLYARRDFTMNPMTNFPIKIFPHKSCTETFHMDYTDENTSNWMGFVAPASNAKEQNLMCYQIKKDIFYTAIRAIDKGEELRVWYADYYASKMGMPILTMESTNNVENLPVMESDKTSMEFEHMRNENTAELKKEKTKLSSETIQKLAEHLSPARLGARENKNDWNCNICSTVHPSIISFAKHLMEHYKPLLGVFCDICNQQFLKTASMQKHKRLKHPEGIASSDAVGIPTSENQQLQNAQTILMNMSDSDGQTSEAMKDMLEKFKAGKTITESSFALNSMNSEKENRNELPLLDPNSMIVGDLLQNTGALLESQCLNLGLGVISDSILSENIADVDPAKFNVEELLDITPPEVDGINRRSENLVCDICTKKFKKVDYLYRHLRKHSGEFLCPDCMNAFARKENLKNHSCPMQKMESQNFNCSYCQKNFLRKKYLLRHMLTHIEPKTCKWCRIQYDSRMELDAHHCQAPMYVCSQCGKRFVREAHLIRHEQFHDDPKPAIKKTKKRKRKDKPMICEKCGEVFKNIDTLKQHSFSHGEREFECDICHNKFRRLSILKQHKQTHTRLNIPCNICKKTFKNKKALNVHVNRHGAKAIQCEKCEKSFFQRSNYLQHYKRSHSKKMIFKCLHCTAQYTAEATLNRHMESHVKTPQHSCSACSKAFYKEHQLKRHVDANHRSIVYSCPFCTMKLRHRNSIKRHFERAHKELDAEWNKSGFVNNLVSEQVVPTRDEIGTMRVTTVDTNGVEDPVNAQGLILLGEDQQTHTQQVSVQSNDNDVGENSMNGQGILFQVADIVQSNCTTQSVVLPADNVPQLSISEADAHLAETVLGNTYIFGEENNDIMFYVLDNAPVLNEF